jgi:hypothetical protein
LRTEKVVERKKPMSSEIEVCEDCGDKYAPKISPECPTCDINDSHQEAQEITEERQENDIYIPERTEI